jgi:hypothetical protein
MVSGKEQLENRGGRKWGKYQHVSNLGNSMFTERTSRNLERSHHLPHVCTKMIYRKFDGYCLQEKLMIYLTPGRRLCFANLFFPTASIDSQLVEQPPLHSHSTASSPAFSSSPGVQTRMLWRLSAFRAL